MPHIEITPGVRGGKPRIAGRRITVADIAILYLRIGQSLEAIAQVFRQSHPSPLQEKLAKINKDD